MNILYAASEAAPFIKTGGLADVAGSLPQALKADGHEVSVVIPLYSKISEEFKVNMKKIDEFYVDLGWRSQYAGILTLESNNITYYFIDNKYYFNRSNIYGEFDDGERFIFFTKAIAIMIKRLGLDLQIIHANDWHTGLLPLYIKDFAKGDPYYKDIKTVFTIHNLKYQGVFPAKIMEEVAGLSREYFTEDGLKFYDSINLMKAGIVYCDSLTTVSKSYAEEIKHSFFGEMLQGIIRKNEHKLVGIVNGIDYKIYNPLKDPNIETNYNFRTIEKKALNKLALQDLYNLPKNKDIPMLAMVTRLVAMKGLDLIRRILDELLQEDIQFVMLGTGDKEYEDMFNYFQYKYPNKVASRNYFNEKESHLIYAAADLFIMPSMAEPCGISQLISLRYGTLPVVREAGGLKDTIKPYNEFNGKGNGFSFENLNAHELLFTIKRALELYKDKEKWNNVVRQAMASKNEWKKSSKEYTELYENLIKQ